MNKERIMYTEAPKTIAQEIVNNEKMDDFLPSPEELVRKKPKVQETQYLSQDVLVFQ